MLMLPRIVIGSSFCTDISLEKWQTKTPGAEGCGGVISAGQSRCGDGSFYGTIFAQQGGFLHAAGNAAA